MVPETLDRAATALNGLKGEWMSEIVEFSHFLSVSDLELGLRTTKYFILVQNTRQAQG